MTYETDIVANKMARESIDGLMDVLQADSQPFDFSPGEIGRSGLSSGLGAAGSLLPDFSLSDESDDQWQGFGKEGSASSKCRALDDDGDAEDESDPEGGAIRQAKKEKSSSKEDKQDDSDEEGGNIRQAKKEKASSKEGQHFESDPEGGKIRQMKKEKAG